MNLFNYLMAKKGHNTSVRNDLFAYLLGKKQGQILPEEYTQVDYIQSSGTQYIDIGYIFNSKSKINCKGGQLTSAGGLLGERISGSNGIYMASNQIKVSLIFHSNIYRSDLNTGTLNDIIITSTNFILNNDIIGTYTASDYQDLSLCLFAINTNGNIDAFSSSKIYYLKIYEDDVLIKNFIPCYRNSDNEVGLYDTVNNVFYTNQGTGEFLYG